MKEFFRTDIQEGISTEAFSEETGKGRTAGREFLERFPRMVYNGFGYPEEFPEKKADPEKREERKEKVSQMIEAVSCGGVVIFRGKILLLYKNFKNRYEGWVLPKGTVEPGETHEQTALREVKEESGAEGEIVAYLGYNSYSFVVPEDKVEKSVHWYLMKSRSYYSKPQLEEYFKDSGYYKYHEAIHLLKFQNEKEMLIKAYELYQKYRREGAWD